RRAPKQAAQRSRRNAMIDGPRDAFAGVDVPGGRAVEPAAARQLKATTVAGSLESALGDDRVRTDHLEVEARLERLIHESELHQRRLEQHAAIAEQRQKLGGVLAADVDSGMTRVATLEA